MSYRTALSALPARIARTLTDHLGDDAPALLADLAHLIASALGHH